MLKKIFRYYRNNRNLKKQKRVAPAMIYGYHQYGVFLKNTRIGSSCAIVNKEGLALDDNVFIGQFNFIEASNKIVIKKGTQITNYISILSHSSHNSIRYYGKEYRKNSNLKGYVKGPVEIGEYCFVGPHVTIMPNTRIGRGSIVSAFSLVKGDFPDFSILSGNPAVVVGDTREKDQKFLNENPELKSYYEEWAK